MTSRTASISLVAALCAGLLVVAFILGPRSCRGGLTAYFWIGVAVTLVFLAIPFTLGRTMPLLNRAFAASALVVLGVVVWVGGLFAANFSIFCRLM